jgi:DNA polymerase I
MSCNCAGALTSAFDGFREIWDRDYEFRIDENGRPSPVSLFAKELRTGREIFLREGELRARPRHPFDAGPNSLVISYMAAAELGCDLALGYGPPVNVICTYVETSAAINGLTAYGLARKRPSLLESCDLFGIAHMSKTRKDEMRDLILNHRHYDEDQWARIKGYNADDVLADIPLFLIHAPRMDVPMALFRGEYLKVVAAMEARGIGLDAHYLEQVKASWDPLRMRFIRRDDHLQLWDEAGVFHKDRLDQLIEARGWYWPRTETGQPSVDRETLGRMAARHPELKTFQRLHDQIAELRLGSFLNTVGADGASRCPIKPFWTRSGRNQPSGRDLAFLLSLPAWTHGFIRPREGWGIACLDWVAQEPGLGAGLSNDPALLEDYRTGDPHLAFAIRRGLAPPGATKKTHKDLRKTIKPISLGVAYGITKHGIAAQTGKSLLWAQDMLTAWRLTYPVFINWQNDTWAQAVFDETIISPYGWPMIITADTSKRTGLNYMHQAGGSDMMRIAAIAGHAAGIRIVAPVHDAFWIEAPLEELDDAIARMSAIMARAGAEVANGLEIPVEVSADVRWPNCLGDVRDPEDRAQILWEEIRGLVLGDLRGAKAAGGGN